VSSTTGPPTADAAANRRPLSAAEQGELIDLLLRGASPLIACRAMDVAVERYWLTLRKQPRFRTAVGTVYDTLGRNVVAALYKAAMEGNVAAQRFWLLQRRADEWSPPPDDLEDASFRIPTHAEVDDLNRSENAATSVSPIV
jgi:hypothetical protein